MGRVLVLRGILFLLPFAVWFAWAAWSRRTGRPMGATPWAWLVAAACVLVALSLRATANFHTDNRDETYVPAESRPDGSVAEGHFERK